MPIISMNIQKNLSINNKKYLFLILIKSLLKIKDIISYLTKWNTSNMKNVSIN